MEETEILFLLVLCWQLSVVLWNVTLHYRVCQFLLLPAQIKGRELSKNKTGALFFALRKNYFRNWNDTFASDANEKEQNMLQCWQKRCVCLYVLHMILQCHKFRVKKCKKFNVIQEKVKMANWIFDRALLLYRSSNRIQHFNVALVLLTLLLCINHCHGKNYRFLF